MSSAWKDDDDSWVDQEFGRHLEEWRNDSGLNLSQAARLIGITTARLESLEAGSPNRSVKEQEMENIAEVYGIGLDLVRDIALGLDPIYDDGF